MKLRGCIITAAIVFGILIGAFLLIAGFLLDIVSGDFPTYSSISAVRSTSDGGFIMTGSINNESIDGDSNYDAWLVKVDSNGKKQWEKNFDTNPIFDVGYCVIQTTDGGYLLAGGNIGLIKTGRRGRKEWEKDLDLSYSYDLWPAADGGYFVRAGSKRLMKTNVIGNKKWEYIFPPDIRALRCMPTKEGGFIVAEIIKDAEHESINARLTKIDADGNVTWEKDLPRSWISFQSIAQTDYEGYILAGLIYENDSAYSYIAKTDASGDEQWSRTFHDNDYSGFQFLQPTSDGCYVLSGTAISGNTILGKVWLAKIDSHGENVWNRVYSEKRYGGLVHLGQTADGGFVIAGGALGYHFDIKWLIKTDEDGNEQWNKSLENGSGGTLLETADGGVVIAGTEHYIREPLPRSSRSRSWLTKFNSKGDEEWSTVLGGYYFPEESETD
jgi:hypothetical protein